MAVLSLSILEHQKRKDGSFPISIRLGHQGKSSFINTGRHAESWQVASVRGKKNILEIKDKHLLREMLVLMEQYERDISGMGMVTGYDIKDIVTYLNDKRTTLKKNNQTNIDFIAHSRAFVDKIRKQGRVGSANLFNTLLNSLVDYLKGRTILYTSEINKRFIEGYIEFLSKERVITRLDQVGKLRTKVMPPIGAYGLYGRLKDFRTLFNQIKSDYNDDDTGYMPIPQNPFKSIKISSPEPSPKGIDMADIISLYKLYDNYDAMTEREKIGIDLFFLSFFLVGMNTIDLYNIERGEYKNGRLQYNRSKTENRRKDNALISIKVEPEADSIMSRYIAEKTSKYLFSFSFIYSTCDTLTRAINKGLESLCEKNNLSPLTMYVARHSWASIARNECGVIKDDISLALNHRSSDKGMQTTDIYLKKDWSLIDRANRKVIDYLLNELKK